MSSQTGRVVFRGHYNHAFELEPLGDGNFMGSRPIYDRLRIEGESMALPIVISVLTAVALLSLFLPDD